MTRFRTRLITAAGVTVGLLAIALLAAMQSADSQPVGIKALGLTQRLLSAPMLRSAGTTPAITRPNTPASTATRPTRNKTSRQVSGSP